MKERPILFSAPMVRAILEGRKTQTRRVVKTWQTDGYVGPKCPYGAPGDRLWVRETFALEHCCDGNPPPFSDGRPLKRRPADDHDGELPLWTQAHYRATDPEPSLCYEDSSCKRCEDGSDGCCHWKPSIHMPRWASRITLEVTGARVERLQQISESDASDEGVGALVSPSREGNPDQYRKTYRDLWDAINGAESWAANPWVWVVEFRKL